MPVEVKSKILSRHPYLRLRLVHAAIGTYPCHATSNLMEVNRFITVLTDSGKKRSIIRDAVSGEFFPMQPDHWYFVPCGHPSDWDFSPELQFISLQFNLELFYGFDLFRRYPGCASGEAADMGMELKKLFHCDELLTLCRINEILYGFCGRLLAPHSELLRINVKWNDYEPVFDYIQRYGDATTTVEQLAEMLHLRNNVFSRKFHRDIGIAPKVFLLNTLTCKASEMLFIPGASVKETANRLKFSSEYYFSGFFKRQTGMSPSEFQRNHGVKQ